MIYVRSAIVWVVAAAAVTGQEAVRIGVGTSVPWAYMAPDGSLTGFYVEVLREAGRRERAAIEMKIRSDGPDRALASGEIDIWAAAVETPERAKRWHFTAPWWAQDHYLAVAKDSPVAGEGDLAGRTVLRGTSPPFTRPLAEVFPGAKFQPMADVRERLRELCEGRADAVLF